MHVQKMVLDKDLCRVTDINKPTYEAACWPSFALEIFYASKDGAVTCYTCDCIPINVIYFGNKRLGVHKMLCPPVPP